MLTPQQLDTWVKIIRTQAWLNQKLAQDMLQEDGVRIHWYDVLVQLHHCDEPDYGLCMSDLVERVIISNSGMTRLIDRLIEEGLVERRVYEDNRREVYVIITAQGSALVRQLIEKHQARIRQYFMQHLSPEELEVMQRVYRRVQDANGI